jgi:hypothetical protein
MLVFGGKTIVVQARAIPEGMDAVESRRTEKIIVVVESCVCPVEELVYRYVICIVYWVTGVAPNFIVSGYTN